MSTAIRELSVDDTPTREDLIDRARNLKPFIRDAADGMEKDRRVSEEVIQAARDAGLFRLLQPKRYGGLEYDFGTQVKINIELSAADASAGWCIGLGMVHNWLVGQFPLQCQEEVWDDPGTIVCGSYAPVGETVRVDGGFRVTGKWSFSSNVDNCDWVLIGVFVPPEEEGGNVMPSFLLVPKSETTVHDDWHMVGLAATGSKDVICEDLFVPEHRWVTFAELGAATAPGSKNSPLFRIPLLTGLPTAICTPAIGALRGAIDDFIDGAKIKETRGAVVLGGNKVADFPQVQSRVGEATANFRSSRSLLLEDMAETHAIVEGGGSIDVDHRIKVRLSQANAVNSAVNGINALFAATGGPGLHRSNRVQRAWRDINAVAHHISFNWDALSSMYGQLVLGIEPRGQY